VPIPNSITRGLRFVSTAFGAVTACVGLLTALTQFILLLLGHTGLVSQIIAAIGVLVLWFGLVWIWLDKKEIGQAFGAATLVPTYPRGLRRIAGLGIILVPLVYTSGYFAWRNSWLNSPRGITIVVANFEGPETNNYRVTEQVIDRLRQDTKGYNDIRIEALGESISEQQGSSGARQKGQDRNASIVLWGWYGKTSERAIVTAHFEILRSPKSLELRQDREILSPAVSELDRFSVQTQVASEMTYLSLVTVGLARYEIEDFNGAIAAFGKALGEVVPEQMIDPGEIYYCMGTASLLQDRTQAAEGYYSKAIELAPDNSPALANRALCYFERKDFGRALADLNRALQSTPDDIIEYNNRGLAFLLTNKIDPAIADFSQAIHLNPNYTRAYINRSTAYATIGELDKALNDLDHVNQLMPGTVFENINRGLVYTEKRDFDRAIPEYNEAIKSMPDSAYLYASRGLVYEQKGDHEHGMADLNLAVKLDPQNVSARINRGLAYFNAGDNDHAIAEMNSALASTTDTPLRSVVYADRAEVYFYESKFKLALSDANLAIKLNPSDIPAHNTRGLVYLAMDKNRNALEDFDLVAKSLPDYPVAYLGRGTAYEGLGKKENAVADLKKVLDLTDNADLRGDAEEELKNLTK
jgi:tetratricopeptide (TPR) repeat protein